MAGKKFTLASDEAEIICLYYQVSSDCEQSLTTLTFLDSLQYIVRPVHSKSKARGKQFWFYVFTWVKGDYLINHIRLMFNGIY